MEGVENLGHAIDVFDILVKENKFVSLVPNKLFTFSRLTIFEAVSFCVKNDLLVFQST